MICFNPLRVVFYLHLVGKHRDLPNHLLDEPEPLDRKHHVPDLGEVGKRVPHLFRPQLLTVGVKFPRGVQYPRLGLRHLQPDRGAEADDRLHPRSARSSPGGQSGDDALSVRTSGMWQQSDEMIAHLPNHRNPAPPQPNTDQAADA